MHGGAFKRSAQTGNDCRFAEDSSHTFTQSQIFETVFLDLAGPVVMMQLCTVNESNRLLIINTVDDALINTLKVGLLTPALLTHSLIHSSLIRIVVAWFVATAICIFVLPLFVVFILYFFIVAFFLYNVSFFILLVSLLYIVTLFYSVQFNSFFHSIIKSRNKHQSPNSESEFKKIVFFPDTLTSWLEITAITACWTPCWSPAAIKIEKEE